MSAPERIWIEGMAAETIEGYGCWDCRNIYGYDTEYVRADLYDAARAEVERLREAQIRPDVLVSHLRDILWLAGFGVSYVDLMRMYEDAGKRATTIACQSGSESETACEDE